jgi:hypothetical protein
MDDDGLLAVANYRLADNLITFTHTELPPRDFLAKHPEYHDLFP